MFGILNLYKPAGPTSRDCVNRIQRMIRPTKVGHAGTLDPIAEGVLLIAVGQAARLVDWIHRLPKTYRGTFMMGKSSPSVDTESEVTEVVGATIPSQRDLEAALPAFLGLISQVPPIYSAVRIDGKRAYENARAGKDIDMPARQVHIHRLSIVEFEYPRLVLDIECGTGTYIRSLGRDLARRLGTDAIMTDLLRSSIGDMLSSQSIQLNELDSKQAIESQLCNPVRCLTQFPQVVLDEADIVRLHQGKLLDLSRLATTIDANYIDNIIAVDRSGKLQSILSRYDDQYWKPYRNFLDEPK
jgi:tRNA pseudouridine55 synthase